MNSGYLQNDARAGTFADSVKALTLANPNTHDTQGFKGGRELAIAFWKSLLRQPVWHCRCYYVVPW
jgi:hypothetical protein